MWGCGGRVLTAARQRGKFGAGWCLKRISGAIYYYMYSYVGTTLLQAISPGRGDLFWRKSVPRALVFGGRRIWTGEVRDYADMQLRQYTLGIHS
jgi:hypothetical protein